MPDLEGRDSFGYMEPPAGYYDSDWFANCKTCRKYVPESYAKTGDLCIELGPDPKIGDDWSCILYSWWPLLKPNPVVIKDHLVEIQAAQKKAESGAEVVFVPPAVAGLVHRRVQCRRCLFYDADESECELYELLTKQFPEIFDLDKSVKPLACCNFQEPMVGNEDRAAAIQKAADGAVRAMKSRFRFKPSKEAV